MRIRSGVLAAVLVVLLALGLASGLSRSGADRASLRGDPLTRESDDPRRQAVIDAFYDVWLHNQQVKLGWTGAVDGCEPGRVSDAARQATLDQINYFRGLAALRPVTFDGDLTGAAQRAALMMHANDQLSHEPPNWWKCHTPAGDAAAGRSNLALGSSNAGAKAVTSYIADSAHTAVGHRRWLLSPRTAQMAAGSTLQANAVVVVGMPQHRLDVPAWIPWPAAGFFPAPLEPEGQWSLSAANAGTDFSRARVRVTDDAGTAYTVKKFPLVAGYGAPTLVWRVIGLRNPTLAGDRSSRVRVTRIERANERMSPVTWTVTLVRPDRPTVVVEQPVITGTFAVGRQLAVSAGTWRPTPSSWSYRWTRDGEPIPGATYPFYYPTAAEQGHVVSVTVRATAPYYATGKAALRGQRVMG